MALYGGGHLELKKMHKGDFWGIFGIRLGRCPCIIPEKISFLQFYSRFNPNALALIVRLVVNSKLCTEVFPCFPRATVNTSHRAPAQLSITKNIETIYILGITYFEKHF